MTNYLIIMTGLPGTGKTYTARILSNSLGYALIEQNELRRKAGIKKMPQKQDYINRQIDKMVLDLFSTEEHGIIIDSVHRQVCRRNQLYGIASACEKNVVVLECKCSEEEAKKRMKLRPSGDKLLSDPCNPKVYDRLLPLWEPIELDYKNPGQDFVSHLVYDTEKLALERKKLTKNMAKFANTIENIIIENYKKEKIGKIE